MNILLLLFYLFMFIFFSIVLLLHYYSVMYVTVMAVSAYMALVFVFGFIQTN